MKHTRQAKEICVGIQGGGKRGMIVENERNSGGAAKREEAAGDPFDRRQIVVFRAKLEQIGTTCEKGSGDGFRGFLGDVAEIDNGVEAGGVELKHRIR